MAAVGALVKRIVFLHLCSKIVLKMHLKVIALQIANAAYGITHYSKTTYVSQI